MQEQRAQHSQEQINETFRKYVKKAHNIPSQMGEGGRVVPDIRLLFKVQGSKGNGPHYSSMELTSLACAKTTQISEMTGANPVKF